MSSQATSVIVLVFLASLRSSFGLLHVHASTFGFNQMRDDGCVRPPKKIKLVDQPPLRSVSNQRLNVGVPDLLDGGPPSSLPGDTIVCTVV